jgi:hypothetical protein
MPRSLWNEFAADRLDHRALQHIIQRNFSSGCQPGAREVVYPGEPPEYAVRLQFSKDDSLVGIEAGPLLTPDVEARLRAAITDALVDTGPKVFRQVRFADHKLTGAWRYKDHFQILPVPATAPQLDCLVGDHPFIIEVKIIGSKEGFLTSLRAAQAMRRTELLLAGLVNNSVHPLVARSFHGYWVCPPGNSYLEAAYLQPYYYCDLPHAGDDFSSASDPAPLVTPLLLYRPWTMVGGEPFAVPNDLTSSLDSFHSLSTEAQEQFLRSCYWLRQAHREFLESFSSAFMAVITAAEALFETKLGDRCACCGQPQYRLRSSFAQLLQTLVPLAEITSAPYGGGRSFESRVKDLYDTRSTIAHGSDLRGWDDETYAFTPLQSHDDDDLRTLLRIMPLVLAGWLREQVSRADELLASRPVQDSE